MAIDIRCLPPTPQGMGLFLNPPAQMQGYAETYKETWSNRRDEIVMPIPRFVEVLDEAGVDRVVMMASDKETTIGTKFPNDTLADLVKEAPDRSSALRVWIPTRSKKL